MSTEKDLRRKYSELLFAKQNEQRYPEQKGYVKEREKIERQYWDAVLRSKLPKEQLEAMEKQAINELEEFAGLYKQNVENDLDSDKDREAFKKLFMQKVLEELSEPEPNQQKEATPFNKQQYESKSKEFEQKYGYDVVYALKREVLDEIKEMDLTPAQREKLQQIETELEKERKMHQELVETQKNSKKEASTQRTNNRTMEARYKQSEFLTGVENDYTRNNKIDKKQQVEHLTNEIEQDIEDYFATPERLKEYLSLIGNFHQYSFKNTALIHSQFQGATAVASAKFWKDNGFPVKKGEKGIQILVPNKTDPKFKTEDGKWKRIEDATDEEKEKLKANQLEKRRSRLSFSVGHVFDISQTEATSNDLPHIFPKKWLDGQVENYKATLESLKNVANEMNISVGEPFDELGAAKGAFYYDDSGKRNGHIGLNPRNSELQNVKTLLHELAHAKLHHIKHKNHQKLSTAEKEFQTEMTAYTVASYFGMDISDYSLSYLANWTQGKDLHDKEKLLQEVRETATEFIGAMEEGFNKQKTKQHEFEENKDTMNNLFWYEMKERPIGDNSQPKGFVDWKESEGENGIVAYERKLTADELAEFGMQPYEKKKTKESNKKQVSKEQEIER
ncbi:MULTISPECIES: ImmA/IrrE family metallo-endopeptidase [Clostridia]|uniref:ArdC-like ssDNA-binding domain-containing protein n=1 Tax=Clostridia TaxID=186801 RepID=UPI000EA0BDD7|nr:MULTISPECIES: ImmA/IrrE family metallo-endopeptidase [Clostridia]NBJ68738.1 ImmA/IrrE family metallo-endopeptidase [Roseburia sp. 1XD42-34]RKI80590.1 ImmA/IrrE family metallo-endopeptidase [Clostridium sp. 1xD42-85]